MSLEFDERICATCPTADCLVKCQYMDLDRETAHAEMMKVIRGEDSPVLRDCATCYACEEYCTRGNHPFYLITDRREEKGLLTAPRPITNQWINMAEHQGKCMVGDVRDRVMSCCFIPDLGGWASGSLFADLAPSFVLGAEYMCPAVYLHFAKPSVIRERLAKVLENFKKLGVSEVLCLHDECYGTYTSIAPAYGLEVPFKPIHYMEYLHDKLVENRDRIKPLGFKVVYQRPCSSRLSPDQHHWVDKLFELVGVERLERTYQDENALCCGDVLKMAVGYDLAVDVQNRNIADMAETGAEYCVFNCPFCQFTLSEKVSQQGLRPVHMIELCRMAVGELQGEG